MSSIKLELPETGLENEARNETRLSEVAGETAATFAVAENLSSEEQAQVQAFAKQIDLHNSAVITCYGEGAQRKLESFTNKALEGVTGRDVGEIGKLLSEMSVSIKNFDTDVDDGKVLGFFRSTKKKVESLRVRYEEISKSLERIKKELLGQRTTLIVDIKMLDEMYQQNLEYYKELTMYIMAGKAKLEETRSGEMEALRLKAQETNTEENAFAYSDLRDRCDSFENQLYDLELTRQICLQTAPQIRLVQKNDERIAQKIQSSMNNTIPVWKQKITLALAIQHSEDATRMQKEITDLTSEMIRENARRLHASTVAAAREAERGIIDLDAIKTSNAELLATIDEVISIHEEGRKKRAEAEIELRAAEDELKQKLIGMKQ